MNIGPDDIQEGELDEASEDSIDEAFLSELGKAKQTPFKRQLKYFVFLLKGSAQKGVRVINLPHPKTGANAKFVINSEGKLLELQRGGGLCSWFLNDKCIEDGGLFLSTDIDPLFIILPMLDKARKAKEGSNGVFIQELALLSEVDPKVSKFLRPYLAHIDVICDLDSQGAEKFWRLNDEKVLIWLQYKLEAVCAELEKMPDIAMLVRAQATNFRSRGSSVTLLELVKIGLGFIGEYVEKRWLSALETKIGLSAAEVAQAASNKAVYASEEEVAPRAKRYAPTGGFEEELMKEAATPPKKKTNIHAARLAKVDKRGMSPITSFFAKQSK